MTLPALLSVVMPAYNHPHAAAALAKIDGMKYDLVYDDDRSSVPQRSAPIAASLVRGTD